MRAMVLKKPNTPLVMEDLEIPEPEEGQIRIKVSVCGICRTDLHVVDGELTKPKLPLVPGHQIIGTVDKLGSSVSKVKVGDRVGVPWLGKSCGTCRYCKEGRENLCDNAVYTGYQIDGGFAEYCLADENFSFPVSEDYPDLQAAPLMCAGLIGYRSYKMTDNAKKLGFYGFGSAAHILCQVAIHDGKQVYAFTRPDDSEGKEFARKSGAVWAGGSDAPPPEELDAAIIFAPVGDLVPAALKVVRKGGIVVCAGIHMSNIPEFPYKDLWEERVIRSVANLTRKDGEEFLELAPKIPVKTEVAAYPLEKANEALDDLRNGRFSGSAAIDISAQP
jgi:alcohol dehydrogenase, propanol-preferring